MMQMLPWQTHDELATRADLAALTATLRGEMAELRAEFRGEMAELRGAFDLRFATMQRWMAAVIVANGVALATAIVT